MTTSPHDRVEAYAQAITVTVTDDHDGATLLLAAPGLSGMGDPVLWALRWTRSGNLLRLDNGRVLGGDPLVPVDWRMADFLALPNCPCVIEGLLRKALTREVDAVPVQRRAHAAASRAVPFVASAPVRRLAEGYAAWSRLVPPHVVQVYEAFDGAEVVYGEVVDRVLAAPPEVREAACAFLRRNALLGPVALLDDVGLPGSIERDRRTRTTSSSRTPIPLDRSG